MNNDAAASRGRELDRIMEMLDASARLCADVEATLARISDFRRDRARRSSTGTPRHPALMESRP